MPKRTDPTPNASENSFAIVGTRVIDAVRHMRRSPLQRALQRELYSIGEHELTPVQIDMIEVLGTRESWRMSELAAACGVDPSTVTRTFAPLADLGLAERSRSPDDGRLVLVRVTEHGRAQVKRIAKARHQLMRAVLSRLSPQRRILLADIFEEYIQAVEAEAKLRDGLASAPRLGRDI
ncbi:MAG TPA: MarR family transcriptional regulator [Alphaproteobacteria bacterium]|nr:MarR family transcriptional regulator [Alphaproteobacteria bacterium]